MSETKFVELLKEFVAIQSTFNNPVALKQAVDFIANLLTHTPNITIERFESNGIHSFLAYKGKVRPNKFDILLNCHVDVVPAETGKFKAYEKDGRVYGRGTLDMKGTTLGLTQAFIESVNKVPYALGLQIVSDEEIGGADGAYYQLNNGVIADFVIMGEYSNTKNTIYNAARGICWVEVGFKGKAAHGAHLWYGSNAVLKAADFINGVLKLYPTPKQETWATTANISGISTPNKTYNKVPDLATVRIDFRFTQEDPNFRDKQSLYNFIKSIHPEAELLQVVTFEKSVHVKELNPYVQALGVALKGATGNTVNFNSRPGASDGRHFAAKNIDLVEFGLYGAGSHSDNEYVEIASFPEYVQTVRAFLQQPILTKAKLPEATQVRK
jgi:succinyl-diaminopimelate desuccinylase